MNLLIWIGIVFCISQSAMFSGLNLAFFSISKLLLEIESRKNNKHALKIAKLREDSNFLLTTILWGNVGINVLLTLLSNSVMAGIIAFVFSTVIITFLGEIIPQAYFSRHAMQFASLLSPILTISGSKAGIFYTGQMVRCRGNKIFPGRRSTRTFENTYGFSRNQY